MSQHDMTIDTTFGQDIQDALQALASTAKGNSAPSTPYAGQLWLDDTATPWVLKMYDGIDWITVGEVDATTNLYSVKHEAGGLEFDASGVVDGDFIVGTGTGTMGLESGATLRTTVGVGTGDTPTFTGINLGDDNLSNYEEGTWTPVLIGTGVAGTHTYAANGQIGHYTRIGNRCFIDAHVILTDWDDANATGQVGMQTLPFTVLSSTSYTPTLSVVFGGESLLVVVIKFCRRTRRPTRLESTSYKAAPVLLLLRS